MEIDIRATGSSGNNVVLNGWLMIDCGVNWKVIEPIYKDIKLVLLTHSHG